MRYRVIVTPQAEIDLQVAYGYIRDRAPRAARKWMKDLRSSIKTLSKFPQRCALAPESDSLDEPVRQMLFGSGNRGIYRVLFTVIDKTVYIVHVRHGSMLPLSSKEG